MKKGWLQPGGFRFGTINTKGSTEDIFFQTITDVFERFFAVGEIDERFEDLGIISSEVPPASQLKTIENHRETFISKVMDKGGILVGFQLMSILNVGFKWDRKLKNQSRVSLNLASG